MEMIDRLKAPTPKFWKKVRNGMITLGIIGGALIAAPVAIPAGVITVLITAGTVGTALSQLTKEDK
jgi:hypothetical protein